MDYEKRWNIMTNKLETFVRERYLETYEDYMNIKTESLEELELSNYLHKYFPHILVDFYRMIFKVHILKDESE